MADENRERWLRELERTAGESEKKWGIAFSLSLFAGFLGADMFYLDRIGLGLLKLITLGGYGVWWIVDVLRFLFGEMRDGHGGVLRRAG